MSGPFAVAAGLCTSRAASSPSKSSAHAPHAGAAQRREEVMPLGAPFGIEAEAIRQPMPGLVADRYRRRAPQVPADLLGDLEDHEPGRPRGEAALAAELPHLADHRRQRVVGRLMSEVIELRAADAEISSPAADLAVGDAQQPAVEALDPRLTLGATRSEHAQPVARLGI